MEKQKYRGTEKGKEEGGGKKGGRGKVLGRKEEYFGKKL